MDALPPGSARSNFSSNCSEGEYFQILREGYLSTNSSLPAVVARYAVLKYVHTCDLGSVNEIIDELDIIEHKINKSNHMVAS